ncbi:MAG: tRNA (adenosine(37)-N6)-dimethylallyltransferase MiaA [Anaerolineae bacterium]|nr:tRNA (adenosine(37)-N6)-dimethylallyltransferase MiaA [Anaerolineae bacterium]
MPPLVAIAGPTAVGKTAHALAVASALGGEVIGADSRQLYTGMDIGTAKPTPAERAAVPHYLIDVAPPDHTFTLAEYQRMAYAAIDASHARGRLALLVGGTGQYISAVVEGWGIPEVAPRPELRAELEAFAEAHGAPALHDRLAAADPAAAARIDYRNVRRVVRALEVCMATGQPISRLQAKTPPPYRVFIIGLTMARAKLYRRVDARVDAMIEMGLVEEAGALAARYGWETPALSGLGYKQIGAHLRGACPLAEAVDAIKRETHAFVRRQYTWFRKMDGLRWVDVDAVDEQAVTLMVQDWLDNGG